MLNKSNIKGIIQEHEKEISEIKEELSKTDSGLVKKCLKEKLSFLEDNCYRYKMQARAWGLSV